MPEFDTSHVKNIVLLGHAGCGKTTLAECMLFEAGLITRERQRTLLEETASALRRCLQTVVLGEELAAEELRVAAFALGKLLGRVDVEDLLDVIFREFCIGK